jgi:hypothetical protein
MNLLTMLRCARRSTPRMGECQAQHSVRFARVCLALGFGCQVHGVGCTPESAAHLLADPTLETLFLIRNRARLGRGCWACRLRHELHAAPARPIAERTEASKQKNDTSCSTTKHSQHGAVRSGTSDVNMRDFCHLKTCWQAFFHGH